MRTQHIIIALAVVLASAVFLVTSRVKSRSGLGDGNADLESQGESRTVAASDAATGCLHDGNVEALLGIERQLQSIDQRLGSFNAGNDERISVVLAKLEEAISRIEAGALLRPTDAAPTLAELRDRKSAVDWQYIAQLRNRRDKDASDFMSYISLLSYRDILNTIGPPDTISRLPKGNEVYWIYESADGRLDSNFHIKFVDGLVYTMQFP